MVGDESTPRDTHIDDAGLWIPPGLREFTGQVVFRTPRATIQHFQSGGGQLDAYYAMIDESHFGDPEEMRDPRNPGLAPDRVSIKPQGEDAVELTVTTDPELVTDGGQEKLACPACDELGGSPRGLISWVCENPDCPVETFRVIDHEEPQPAEDTTSQELVTDGGRPEHAPDIYQVVELPESETGGECPMQVGDSDNIHRCGQRVEFVFVFERNLSPDSDARGNCRCCADCKPGVTAETQLVTDGGQSTSETYREPVYQRELLEKAKNAQEPVTEVEVSDKGRTTRIHAIQEYDGVAWRVMIRDYSESTDSPSVSFAKSYHDSEVKVMRDWSSMATGRLSGPKDLPSWESLFTVFNAALHEYNKEFRSHGREVKADAEQSEVIDG